MNILVMGAGAIGRYVGGSLQAVGETVRFFDVPAVAEDPKARELVLKHADKLTELLIDIGSDLRQMGAETAFDLVLFAVKSFDTDAAIDALVSGLGDVPPVLCLQNGVENEALLRRRLGAENVIYGTVTTAIGRQASQIIVEKLRGIGISSTLPLADELCASMETAGLKPARIGSPVGMKWSKMLTNLIANATSAILDMPPADIFAHKGLYALEIKQLRETLQVMRTLKVPVCDLPGTPVRLLAFAATNLPLVLSQPLLAKAVGGGRGNKMPSFHIDLKSGRGRSEVGYLNGAVVRFGQQCGVDTPVNAYLTRTLNAIVADPSLWPAYARQPDVLLAEADTETNQPSDELVE